MHIKTTAILYIHQMVEMWLLVGWSVGEPPPLLGWKKPGIVAIALVLGPAT